MSLLSKREARAFPPKPSAAFVFGRLAPPPWDVSPLGQRDRSLLIKSYASPQAHAIQPFGLLRFQNFEGTRYNLPAPTVLGEGPYRFYFYSHEPNEPPHVPVDRDDLSTKFWLTPVALARNLGFSAVELRRLQSMVEEHQGELLEAWHGHFGPDSG